MKGRFPALDGVRGLAILVVLVHNLSIYREGESLLDRIWMGVVGAGWFGVELFFVLSGFLITGILLEPRSKDRVRTFYLRRFLRIGPLYYVGLIAYFFIATRVEPYLARPFKEVVWYWLFLSNWSVLPYGLLPGLGHLWSLAVEEQFYVAWPWVVWRTSPRVFAWICVVIVGVSIAARVAFRVYDFDWMWNYSSTLTRMDALAIGALLALGLRSDAWRPRVLASLRPVAIACGVVLLGTVVWTKGFDRFDLLVQIYGYTVLAIASAVVVASATLPTAPRLLLHPVLRFFGKYSYAIYLFHMPLRHIALYVWKARIDAMLDQRQLLTDVAFITVVTAVTVLSSLVSWRVLEQPALALKDRLAPT